MTDDDLRVRLAALDPAAGLAPLDGTDRAALLATADRPRRRRRTGRGWRIGAAAGLVAVGATAAAVVLAASTGHVVRSVDVGPSTLTLALPDDSTASCARLDGFAAAALAASTLAFRGTVDAVQGDRVALRIEERYRGEPADTVILDSPANTEDATTFTVGEQVLVAAADGLVLSCGLSGEASPELQRYYDAAF